MELLVMKAVFARVVAAAALMMALLPTGATATTAPNSVAVVVQEVRPPHGVALGSVSESGGYVALMLWGADGPWGYPAALRLQRAPEGGTFTDWGVLPISEIRSLDPETAIGPKSTVEPRVPLEIQGERAVVTFIWVPKLDRSFRYRISKCDELRFVKSSEPFRFPKAEIDAPSNYTTVGEWVPSLLSNGQAVASLGPNGTWKNVKSTKAIATLPSGTVLRMRTRNPKSETFAVIPNSAADCTPL